MKEDEKMLWKLFCMTGEPTYYSMYVRSKEKNERKE